MAFFGLFGNYNKPGPGVSKDEPKKAAPIRFFEIFARKFTKLVEANLIFAIPMTVIVALMAVLWLFPLFPLVLHLEIAGIEVSLNVWNLYVVPIPLILVSPFRAGLTFITRNFAREEHAFIWSDFWSAVKGNWKFFLINGLITYLVYFVLSFSMIFYYHQVTSQTFFYVPLILCLVILIVFLFGQYYLPVMFVTFELTFRQAYRNALIFAIAGLFRNILLTVIFGVTLYAFMKMEAGIAILVFVVLYLFLIFALSSYLVNFTVYPLIDSLLIKPYQERMEAEKNGEEKDNSEGFSGLFSNEPVEGEDEEEDNDEKYVYVNGRLIKRSELKKREENSGSQ